MRLTKIRLINWHQFWRDTIIIKGNTLLTGDNGSGKSTLLDAIFFVLSGGEKEFNRAANDESTRTVESYMRGKLGIEGKEFLRDVNSYPDLISHIVLEFRRDDATEKIILIGCVLELSGAGNAKSKFYSLDNIPIENLKLEVEGHISGSDALRDFYGNSLFAEMKTKRNIRANIAKILGLNRNAGEKYHELLKKAIAFKPIKDNISQFVNDFLLKENNINIEPLQNELRSYKEIIENISREKDKKQVLETFVGKAETFKNNLNDMQYIEILKIDYELQKTKTENEKIDREIALNNVKIQDFKRKSDQNDEQITKYEVLLENLKNNQYLRAYNTADNNLKDLQEKYNVCSKELSIIENKFEREKNIIKKLGLGFDFSRDIREKNFILLNTHINNYLDKKNALDDEIRTAISTTKIQIVESKKEAEIARNDLNRLNANQNNYNEKFISLIGEIKENIATKYKKDKESIFVKPICECIDIAESEWADAIEGYLNTQRFDLIVDERYYDDAIKIVNGHKEMTNGIVDVKNAIGEVMGNSLYNKIQIKYPNVDGIMRCLLGKVICVENINELNWHKISISKSCMIYKNYTAKNLSKKAYETPYIGEKSRLKRIEQLESRISSLNKEIDKLEEFQKENQEKLELIKGSLIREQISKNYWYEKDDLEHKIEQQQQMIKALKSNTDIVNQIEEIEKLEAEIKELKVLRDKYKESSDQLQQSIGVLKQKKEENDLKIKVKQETRTELFNNNVDKLQFERFASKYYINNGLNIRDIDKDLESMRNFNNSTKQTILNGMTDYTNKYSKNLFANIDNIQDFIAEYNKIKENDIPSLESKANKVFEETKINFNDNFISVLREKIKDGIEEIKNINKNLRKHPFGNSHEIYEFIWKESGDQEMREYYRIINSGRDIEQKDLFTETLNQRDLDIINRLFEKLSGSENQEKEIKKYLDYRNYLSYDILIKYDNGEKAYFSKIHKDKSGGETQTPFYVIIGACFNELINTGNNELSSCLVIFDEAFNNMDELRIKTLMDFYKELSLQIIIVVPTIRSYTLLEYVDSAVLLLQSNNNIEWHELSNIEV